MNISNQMDQKHNNFFNKINIKQLTCFVVLMLIVLAFCLAACSSVDDRIPEAKQDFCSAVDDDIPAALSEYLNPFESKMKDSTGVYVLEQGTEAMYTRAWLSDQAEKTIDVQYFIFSSDNIGLIAFDYLVKAAERGVKVRVLVDDLMIDAKGEELLKLSAHENLSIKIYNPMINIGKNITQKLTNLTTDFHGINQRMHNKTFTVDSKVAITGGRNIADEYFGFDHEFNFRDRDVLLLGGITTTIQSSFDQFWHDDLSVPIERLISGKPNTDFNALHQYACDPANFDAKIRAHIAKLPEIFSDIQQAGDLHWLKGVEYVSDLPGKNDGSKFLGGGGLSTQRLIELVNQAKTSVIIQTPYLVTTDLGKNIFKALVNRGVDVKILTNSLASNDNLEAFSGYQRDRKALLKTGIKLYEFKDDAEIRQKVMSSIMEEKLASMPIFGLHAKSMVIDDNITVIGTFNVDPRSANLNTESIIIIPSKALATKVKLGMLEEMQPENAWEITDKWNPDNEVSKLKRLGVKLRRIVPKNIL